MDLSSILLAVVVFLGATAICVILFERLGFGSVLGFIIAGILIGPHTPGPVPVHRAGPSPSTGRCRRQWSSPGQS